VTHALMRAHPLGLLASNGADGQTANPIPFLLDANHGAYGRLRGHLSEPNERGTRIAPPPTAKAWSGGWAKRERRCGIA